MENFLYQTAELNSDKNLTNIFGKNYILSVIIIHLSPDNARFSWSG